MPVASKLLLVVLLAAVLSHAKCQNSLYWDEVHMLAGGVNATMVLTSPGFPNYTCDEATWVISCVPPVNRTCYIEYHFLDFDIPPSFQVSVYKGYNVTSPKVFTLMNHGGIDVRGSVMMPQRPGNGRVADVMTLTLRKSSNATCRTSFAGFRVKLTRSKPYLHHAFDPYTTSDCPAVVGSLEAGALIKGSLVDWEHNNVECIYLIKPSERMLEDGKEVFARFDILVGFKGEIEILRGPYSTSPVLMNLTSGGQSAKLDDLQQPIHGFTSSQGLYIRILATKGIFHLVLAEYQPVGQNTDQSMCLYGGEAGVLCKAGEVSMCLSSLTLCDKVPICLHSQDENNQICDSLKTVPSTTASCDGKWVKRCSNRKCIEAWNYCPEECVLLEDKKLCQDGRCIPENGFCDQRAVCKSGQTSCNDGRGCYWLYQRCDGYSDCLDRSDEVCSTTTVTITSTVYYKKTRDNERPSWAGHIIALVATVVILAVIICSLFLTVRYVRRRLRGQSHLRQPSTADTIIVVGRRQGRDGAAVGQGGGGTGRGRRRPPPIVTQHFLSPPQPSESQPQGGRDAIPDLLQPPSYDDCLSNSLPPSPNASNNSIPLREMEAPDDSELPPYEAVAHIKC